MTFSFPETTQNLISRLNDKNTSFEEKNLLFSIAKKMIDRFDHMIDVKNLAMLKDLLKIKHPEAEDFANKILEKFLKFLTCSSVLSTKEKNAAFLGVEAFFLMNPTFSISEDNKSFFRKLLTQYLNVFDYTETYVLETLKYLNRLLPHLITHKIQINLNTEAPSYSEHLKKLIKDKDFDLMEEAKLAQQGLYILAHPEKMMNLARKELDINQINQEMIRKLTTAQINELVSEEYLLPNKERRQLKQTLHTEFNYDLYFLLNKLLPQLIERLNEGLDITTKGKEKISFSQQYYLLNLIQKLLHHFNQRNYFKLLAHYVFNPELQPIIRLRALLILQNPAYEQEAKPYLTLISENVTKTFFSKIEKHPKSLDNLIFYLFYSGLMTYSQLSNTPKELTSIIWKTIAKHPIEEVREQTQIDSKYRKLIGKDCLIFDYGHLDTEMTHAEYHQSLLTTVKVDEQIVRAIKSYENNQQTKSSSFYKNKSTIFQSVDNNVPTETCCLALTS